MKPEDWVVSGVIQVGHMSTTSSSAMNDIVDGFETVGVLESRSKGVRLGAEFAVIAIECEEIV